MVSALSDSMDPHSSSSSAVGQEDIARLFQELQQLRDTNAGLQREVQGLAAQVQQGQQRPVVQAVPLRKKPSTFTGEERMLEGWLSSTRDILVDCYQLGDGPEIIRAARIYLEGPARTSWDALERSRGPGGGLTTWGEFAAWLRATHGSAAPQIVQGTLLMRLKMRGTLQGYINKWNSIAAQLPMALPDDIAKLWFVENLDASYHSLASQYQVAHPACNLQDIMQYLRMVNVDVRTRGLHHVPMEDKPRGGPTPMEVDLKSLTAQLANIERRLDAPSAAEGYLSRLTAEERKECMEKELCFICKQPGHQGKNCPKRKRKGGGQQRR